jgi:hypothetical protein
VLADLPLLAFLEKAHMPGIISAAPKGGER